MSCATWVFAMCETSCCKNCTFFSCQQSAALLTAQYTTHMNHHPNKEYDDSTIGTVRCQQDLSQGCRSRCRDHICFRSTKPSLTPVVRQQLMITLFMRWRNGHKTTKKSALIPGFTPDVLRPIFLRSRLKEVRRIRQMEIRGIHAWTLRSPPC